MYINNLFVNPEIHDVYIKRIGFSLIRVFRHHIVRSNHESHDEKLLSQLKWPIETIFIGLRPTWNRSDSNPNKFRDWHRGTKTVDVRDDVWDHAEVAGDAGATDHVSRVGQVVPDTYVKECPTVQSMSLSAHGITLLDSFDQRFYNSYIPYKYGGNNIVTPSDEGVLMVTFCLYPGSYQPSGHINVSRAREFFVSWVTNFVGSDNSADFVAVAIAINFLLITDGSAVLRYST